MPRTKKKKTAGDYTCAACGVLFPAKRDDAQYCGSTCRQRISRDNRKRLSDGMARPRAVGGDWKECRRCGTLSQIKATGCFACGVSFTNKK